MKIAFFTPVSPVQSALADFGEGLAMALAQLPDISVDLFLDGTYTSDNEAVNRLNFYPHTSYPAQKDTYNITLYSMGDSGRIHGYMLDYIYKYPGIVIMNDVTIHRAIADATIGKNNPQAYVDTLHYAHPEIAANIALHLQSSLGSERLLEYPLFERVVDNSMAVIVQNNYARDRILEKRPSAHIRTIPYPFFMPPGTQANHKDQARVRERQKLNLDIDQFVIGSFGIFVPNKHLEACLAAFAYLLTQKPEAHYILGGSPANEYDLHTEIRKLGLDDNVTITGWLSPPEFAQQMFALDVGIHLRYPHIGGTPYTPIRLMGLGIATIVSDIEPLAELPPGSCAKIHPDDYAEKTLQLLLTQLAADKNLLQQLGQNGQHFIQKHHDLHAIAQQYVDFFTAV